MDFFFSEFFFALSFLLSLCIKSSISVNFGSFNIRSGNNISDIFDLKGTASAINSLKIDIIGLQEVDSNTNRHPVDEPVLLKEYTSMKEVEFVSMRRFEGGHYGIAILSNLEIIQKKVLRFGGKSEEECKNYKKDDYCQGALAVKVKENDIWFVTTHLGLAGIQENEANLLVEWIEKELSSPVFITGDFNTTPDSETHKIMSSKFNDLWLLCGDTKNGFTFPSDNPTERIDYIYSTEKNCNLMSVKNTQASDHRPVSVTIDM